jgi:hypothetical protein
MPRYKIAFGIGDETLPETQMIVDTHGWDASSREEFEKMLIVGKGTWKIFASPTQDKLLQSIEIER